MLVRLTPVRKGHHESAPARIALNLQLPTVHLNGSLGHFQIAAFKMPPTGLAGTGKLSPA
jgi:hypothetical protein